MSDIINKDYMDTITLICANCGGKMEIDKENNIAKCPFCGESKLLAESDNVIVERIRNKTFEDVASEKIQAEKEIEQARLQALNQEATEKKLAKIRKSPLTIILALVTIYSLFSVIESYQDKYLVSAIIMGFQTLLFFVAWLMRMRLIKGAEKRLHTLFTVLAILLLIPFLMFIGKVHSNYEKYVWPSSNLAAMLPKPQSEYGEIEKDAADKLLLSVGKVKENDYSAYLEECKEKGFTINASLVEYEYTAYTAFNESGAELRVSFFPHLNEMEILLEGYPEFYEFEWTGRGLSALLPEPVSKLGIVSTEKEDSFSITVAETSISEFNEYVNTCMEAGFTEDILDTEDYFSAETTDGVTLIIKFNVSGVMEIFVYTK